MRGASFDAAITLAAGIATLVVLILLQQIAHRIRRRANLVIRPAYEFAVAEYLGTEDTPGPPSPKGRRETVVLRQVALAALIELRGRERARLTELLEQTGVIAFTVAELRSPKTLRRRRAADMLAEMRSAQARPALLDGLRDRDRAVRLGCARALAELADESSASQVFAVAEAEAEASPGAVSDVLLVLASWKPSLLAEGLRTTASVPLRRMLTAIFGELRLAAEAPLLRHALADEDDVVARRAARGLGLIGDHESVPDLAELVADSARADETRATAAVSLGWIGDAQAVAPLRSALRSSHWAVETAARQALALLRASTDDDQSSHGHELVETVP